MQAESIKELVTDGNFECTETGISLQSMDSAHVALVHLLLKSSGFESFKCEKTVTLGINMGILSKMLKCIDSDSSLILKTHEGGDTVSFTLKGKDESVSEFEIKLVEIEGDQLGIPDAKYTSVVKMPSNRFKKIITDLSSMGDTCSIKIAKKAVTFSVKGEEISGSTTVKSNSSVDEEGNVAISSKEEVSLSFAMKYLTTFAKAYSLSDSVTLSLSSEAPLMVEYTMKELGHIRYYLAPKIDDDESKKEE